MEVGAGFRKEEGRRREERRDGEEVQIQLPLLLAQLTSPGGMFLPKTQLRDKWAMVQI